MTVRVLEGHVLDRLAELPSDSVQCVVTSPPYWGLRAYGTEPQVWGGDPGHEHEWGHAAMPPKHEPRPDRDKTFVNGAGNPGALTSWGSRDATTTAGTGALCVCGAWRGELGSEPDVGMFVAHMVEIFREVRRVLRPDGTCWVNLGDSMAGSGRGPSNGLQPEASQIGPSAIGKRNTAQYEHGQAPTTWTPISAGLKAKDLCLIPERFALAMQADGWYVRSRIAWCKTSAMPESVTDRPTSAWEHIWLLTKSARYYYDAEAVRQPQRSDRGSGNGFKRPARLSYMDKDGAARGSEEPWEPSGSGANLRNYWVLGPEPSREEHYAAYPTEIPRRAILAGTSERGQCSACGAPWARVVERNRNPSKGFNFGKDLSGGAAVTANPQTSLGLHRNNGNAQGPAPRTTGWAPTCRCDAGDPVPQVVLDCFLGSGTTALVADQLGRDAIGIELQPSYAAMAVRRVTGDAPMFARVEHVA